jgi:hypothetical protein
VLEEMCVEYGVDFTMSVVPTPLTFFEMGEELFLSDAVSGRSRVEGRGSRGEQAGKRDYNESGTQELRKIKVSRRGAEAQRR